MRVSPSPVASLLSAAVALAIAPACAPSPEQRCNSDIECASRACILGACRDSAFADAARDVDVDGDGPDEPALACAGGDVLAYVDADQDGHGAGAARCEPALAPGLSELGDDCDDANAAAHALRTVWDDADGDGFSAASHLVCIGDEGLPGTLLQRGDAPVQLVEPTEFDVVDGLWDDGVFDPRAAEPTGVVKISGFACASLPARVSGLEVRLNVENLADQGFATVGAGVQVEVGGVLGTRFFAPFDIDGVALLTAGGPGDTMGLALSPADVCDPSFAVFVTLDAPDALPALFVVEATAVAFGADDCDDADPGAWSPASLRTDVDGDGWAAGPSEARCIGDRIPDGLGVRDADCAPDDEDAFPGQLRRFDRERYGVGGFDFNCNEAEERLDTSVARVTECSFDGTTCSFFLSSVNPTCGDSETVFSGCAGGCVYGTFTQACR